MKVKIESIINGELAEVWNFWTEPKHIVNWNFASKEWCCPVADNDLKVGGKYSTRMEAKDGSMGFDLVGTYIKVDKLKGLIYKMEDERVVETSFEEEGDKVKVTTTFDAEAENSEELQRNGWQSILDNFKEYAENN